jgi:hypothetical protein
MPHPANQLRTVKLRLSTSPAVLVYLKQLVGTGLYGRHHTDAAERLIAQGIEALIERGILKPLGPDQE